MNKIAFCILASLLLGSLAAACRSAVTVSPAPSPLAPSAGSPASAASPTLPQATLTSTTTAAPQPSATSSPSETTAPTEIQPTETPTPASFPVAIVAIATTFIRSGPAEAYPQLALFSRAMILSVVGRSEAADWLAVDLGLGQVGWIHASNVVFEAATADLPVIEVPPPPPPTSTPVLQASVVFWLDTVNERVVMDMSNFKPDESYAVICIRLDTGNQVVQGGGFADSNGSQKFRPRFSSFPANVPIQCTLTNESGQSWSSTFTIVR